MLAFQIFTDITLSKNRQLAEECFTKLGDFSWANFQSCYLGLLKRKKARKVFLWHVSWKKEIYNLEYCYNWKMCLESHKVYSNTCKKIKCAVFRFVIIFFKNQTSVSIAFSLLCCFVEWPVHFPYRNFSVSWEFTNC